MPSVKLLRRAEVFEVFVVGPDFKLTRSAFKEVLPLLQCSDNGQHLLVMDLVVLLNWAETLGEEGNWVPFSTIH